jgi:LPXTG-motif cell wall-anchored protein
MYGKTVGTLNVATGISLLPDTGNSRTLFIIAASLLVSGVAIFVIATVLARKSRQTEAN